MERKTISIDTPNNLEIDWQESAKQEKIVFKKKDTKPRSWEEYCATTKRNGTYFIGPTSGIIENRCGDELLSISCDRNLIPSKELAEAFLAMMQLMSLRQAWIGDWKPDWSCGYSSNYCIIGTDDHFNVCTLSKCRHALSFPTQKMATDFMNCFRDLLEIAKPLI